MVMSTAGTSSSTNADSEDAWGQPVANPTRRHVVQSTPIPDDWDADDGEEEAESTELWEIANSRTPMPEIQLSTTTSSAGTQLPPPAAFEAPLRILKRPLPNSKSSPLLTGSQSPKSFQEREAQYQAARERIFGQDAAEKSRNHEKPKPVPNSTRSTVIRDPLGPASPAADGDARPGFLARRKKTSPEVIPEAGGEAKEEDNDPFEET